MQFLITFLQNVIASNVGDVQRGKLSLFGKLLLRNKRNFSLKERLKLRPNLTKSNK